jgi:hypothetical protein
MMAVDTTPMDRPVDAAPTIAATAIDDAWGPLDPDYFDVAPPARSWLLRHPPQGETATRTVLGDGLLPRGKAGLFVADGGLGKTLALLALACCVVTGRPWLDHYAIGADAVGGRVLLVLAEEDREEIHRRLYTVSTHLGLTAAERRTCAEQIVILPMAGRPVALVAPGADGRIGETPELGALRRRLADGPWVLVVLDPLARFAEGEIETSNDGATRAVQAIESLTQAAGCPTVLVAHHTSAEGARTGSPTARGVTAIRNGFRWEGTLRKDGTDILFRQTKSNYSAPMDDDLRLVRGDGGMLRAATEADLELRAEAANDAAASARSADVERVVRALADRGVPAQSRDQIVAWAGIKKDRGRLAVAEALTLRLIVQSGTKRDPQFVCGRDPHTPGASGRPTPSAEASVRLAPRASRGVEGRRGIGEVGAA